jgi:hypothetical protein
MATCSEDEGFESTLREILSPSGKDTPGVPRGSAPPARPAGTATPSPQEKGKGLKALELAVRIAAGLLVLYLLYRFGFKISRL